MNNATTNMKCNKDYICLKDSKMQFPEITFYVVTGIVLTSVCVLVFYVIFKGFMVIVSATKEAN